MFSNVPARNLIIRNIVEHWNRINLILKIKILNKNRYSSKNKLKNSIRTALFFVIILIRKIILISIVKQ